MSQASITPDHDYQRKKPKSQPDWWQKSLAGVVLGYAIALAISGLFAWLGYGGIDAPQKVQFNMWIISPIWLTILSFSFMFPTGVSAIKWLGSANLVAYTLLFIVRF